MSYKGRKIGVSLSILLILVVYLYIEYSLSAWLGVFLSVIGIICSYVLGRKIDYIITQTNQDRLTKRYNRKLIEESFPKLRALASRNNSKLFLLVIDCDNFKLINDHYGHAKGDVVLQSLSRLLLNQFRNSDLVSRWGGDEFVVIGQLSMNEGLNSMITRIHTNIHKLSNEIHIPLSISVGYAVFPDDHFELQNLFEIADLNMYKEKTM